MESENGEGRAVQHPRRPLPWGALILGISFVVLLVGSLCLPSLLSTIHTLVITRTTTASHEKNVDSNTWVPPEGDKWCPNCTILKDVLYVRREGILCFNESRLSESRNTKMIISVSEGFIVNGEHHNNAFVGDIRLYGMRTPKCAKHVELAEATDTASSSSLRTKRGDVAFLAPPASGGMYLNLWHQVADILFSYFVTLAPIIPLDSNYLLQGDGVPREEGGRNASPFKEQEFPTAQTISDITWLTVTPWKNLRVGCYSEATCDDQTLFMPFTRLFHHYYFMDDLSAQINNTLHHHRPPDYLRYNDLLIGRDIQCDVYKLREIVRPEYCARALRGFNQFLFHNGDATNKERVAGVSRIGYGANRSLTPDLNLVRLNNNITTRVVTAREVECPQIRYVTRSTQRYRRVLPTAEFEHSLLHYFNTSFTHCLVEGLTASDFVKPLSFSYSTPFDGQFRALQKVSLLIAGRGAITTLSIGLPDGAAYFGLAGHTDPWEPYGHVQMKWVTFKHFITKMRRPEKAKQGKALNPNNANYIVNIPNFIKALNVFYGEWKANVSSLIG